MARFEKMREKKNQEMAKVCSFLINTVGMKVHKGIFMQQKSVEYFRGVNFHIAVLQAAPQIMKMIPSFTEVGDITQLKTIEDSIKLGQHMILCQNILQLRKDPRLVQSGNEKTPKFVVPERQSAPMTDKGIYMIIEKEDPNSQKLYLALIVVVVLALMCFRLWPLWLKKVIWYISFYLLVFLVVTAILRLIIWVVLYHFGFEVWLFPNYFIDSNDPRDSFLPVWSYEVREDWNDFKSIIFRMVSGSLLVYMLWQFCQDEQNIADLQDLAENGLTDLFEYGAEFVIGGNALGDGKPKDNTTDTRQETFAEKTRRNLDKVKDVDDLEQEETELTEEDLATTEEDAPFDIDAILGASEDDEEEPEKVEEATA